MCPIIREEKVMNGSGHPLKFNMKWQAHHWPVGCVPSHLAFHDTYKFHSRSKSWKTIIFMENHYLQNVLIPSYFRHNSTWIWCVFGSQLCFAQSQGETNVLMWCAGDYDSCPIKNKWYFFYIQNIPLSTRIHGEPLGLRCCTGDQLWRCFLTGLMLCQAGLKLFRTSLRGLLCHLGPKSLLYHHNTGSMPGKITDKIMVFYRFWLVLHEMSWPDMKLNDWPLDNQSCNKVIKNNIWWEHPMSFNIGKS